MCLVELSSASKCTVILFSSRYLFPAKSICPTCTQAIQIVMQIRAAAPHPIETFVIFLFKFVLLGQKYNWPKPDRQDLHWANGKRPFAQGLRTDSRASSGRIWHLASRHSIKIWPFMRLKKCRCLLLSLVRPRPMCPRPKILGFRIPWTKCPLSILPLTEPSHP